MSATATAVGTISGLWGDLMNAVGASERVFQLLKRVPQVKWKDGDYIENPSGRITLEKVRKFLGILSENSGKILRIFRYLSVIRADLT